MGSSIPVEVVEWEFSTVLLDTISWMSSPPLPPLELGGLSIMAAVTTCSDFGAQENELCHCFHFPPSICHEVMGPDAMVLVF